MDLTSLLKCKTMDDIMHGRKSVTETEPHVAKSKETSTPSNKPTVTVATTEVVKRGIPTVVPVARKKGPMAVVASKRRKILAKEVAEGNLDIFMNTPSTDMHYVVLRDNLYLITFHSVSCHYLC